MTDEQPRATLGDKQSRGGVIGGKVYGFQAAYIVSRIPLWLADPDFAQFLQEGADDGGAVPPARPAASPRASICPFLDPVLNSPSLKEE